MPQQDPQIGELWQMADALGREQRGTIVDVDTTGVTVVSFAGHRTKQALTSFHMMWSFLQPAPRTGLTCARRGCPEQAVFKWRRDGSDEYICPRHAPRGIQLEYLTDAPVGVGVQNRTSQGEISCPSCASPDPTEDLSLPKPDRAPWSWWGCTLCGRYWATIGGPSATLTGAAVRGAWYYAQITSALGVIAGLGTVGRIEAGRAAFGDLRSITPVDPQQFDPTDVRLVIELEPTAIHIVLQNRPAQRLRSAMGVQRLGGRPNRPAAETGVVLAHPTRLSNTLPRAIVQEPLAPAPAPAPPAAVAPPPPTPAPFSNATQADLDTLPEACRVTIGERWRQVDAEGVVIIMEDMGTQVVYRSMDVPFPITMARADFLTLYAPLRSPTESPYAEVLPGQEWRTESGEDVVVEALHEKRHTVTVKLKDGKTATYAHRDFDRMQKITRRSAYAHLAHNLREGKE